MRRYGKRRDVWYGYAEMTRGGLTKKDLFMKHGRLKSRRKSASAKRMFSRRTTAFKAVFRANQYGTRK